MIDAIVAGPRPIERIQRQRKGIRIHRGSGKNETIDATAE